MGSAPLKVPIESLEELGYSSYRDYLLSDHWRRVRETYRRSRRPQKCFCGERKVQIHHMTYRYLGREQRHLKSLRALCDRCHRESHGLNK